MRPSSWAVSLFVFLFLIVTVLTSAIATDRTIAGHWEGSIKLPQMELNVLIDLTQLEDGSWTGTIDIPLQAAKGLPLKNIMLDGSNATFSIEGPPGDPTFDGTLSEDGSKIEGDFTQASQTFAFQLTRTGEAEVGEIDPSRDEALENIDEFIRTTMESWNVPGAGIAIIKNGEPILLKGYGFRDIEQKLPVTKDTQFAIGSSSKAFTTLILGMLVEDGTIEWDEPVRTYLPTFELDDEFATKRMTPRDLVCHRSGLPRHDLLWYGSKTSREKMFEHLKHLEPSTDFRTNFQYQNLMFMTAGYLAGQVTGSSWEYLVTERILAPLGMDNSNTSVDDMQRASDFSFGYEEKDDEETNEKKIERMGFRNIDAMGPAGSVNSSVDDMVEWVKFQLNKGKVGDEQVVSPVTIEELHRSQIVVHGGLLSQLLKQPEMPHMMYGLGWFVQPYRGHELIHHGGNIDGFSAMVSFMPEDNIGVVILTNLNGTPLPIALTFNIYDRLLGLEEIDWNGRYKLVWTQLEQAQDESEGAEQVTRKSGTKPSHSLDDYAGVYMHPAYGLIEIAKNGKTLAGTYNHMTFELEHWHYDVFRSKTEPFEGLKLVFLANLNGDIDRVTAALEQSVDPIEFAKEPPKEMFERDFLEQFVGEYELMGLIVTVGLRGDNTLTVAVPGQPAYELTPYMGTEFNLKGQEGASIKFMIEKGDVTEAFFIQPNGVFSAKRKD